jgi:hypothetical protein
VGNLVLEARIVGREVALLFGCLLYRVVFFAAPGTRRWFDWMVEVAEWLSVTTSNSVRCVSLQMIPAIRKNVIAISNCM